MFSSSQTTALVFFLLSALVLPGCDSDLQSDPTNDPTNDPSMSAESDEAEGTIIVNRTEDDRVEAEIETTGGDERTVEVSPEPIVEPVDEEPIAEPADDAFMPLSDQGDVVEFVEIARYMGVWYEIATTPSFQQASCYGTQAEYTFNAAQGWVDVVNTCRIGDLSGTPQQIQGKAELVDTETQAKLVVTFFGQSSPYWVVALDGSEGEEPYQWAAVSVPGNQVIWLLSRTKEMDAEQRQMIEDHLAARGFPVENLLDTPQVIPEQ